MLRQREGNTINIGVEQERRAWKQKFAPSHRRREVPHKIANGTFLARVLQSPLLNPGRASHPLLLGLVLLTSPQGASLVLSICQPRHSCMLVETSRRHRREPFPRRACGGGLACPHELPARKPERHMFVWDRGGQV